MMKIQLLAIVTIISITSCSKNRVSDSIVHIPIEGALSNVSTITMSMLGSKIRYLPLETTPESFIGANPNVSIYKDKIIVASGGTDIKIFDAQSGAYLCSVGEIGNGPQGSLSLGSYLINRDSNEIYLSSPTPNTYRVWDLNGNFLRTVAFPAAYRKSRSFSSDYEFIDKDTLMVVYNDNYNFCVPDDSVTTKILTSIFSDLDSERIESISFINSNMLPPSSGSLGSPELMFESKSGGRDYIYLSEKPLWRHNEKLFIKSLISDTAYLVTTDGATPAFIFETGRYGYIAQERLDGMKRDDKRVKIGQIKQTEKLLFFECYPSFSEPLMGLYNIKENRVILSKYDDKITDDINGFMPVLVHSVADDNSLIALIEPFEIIDWKENNPSKKNLLPKVRENDNIVIAIIE